MLWKQIALVIALAVVSADAQAGTNPDAKFIARAENYCAQASDAIHALPPFPFKNFDALHPDPKVLVKVGRFFQGAGNEVPIAIRLERQLRGLGTPAANPDAWRAVLATWHDFVIVIEREAADASHGHVAAWVQDVQENRLLPDRLEKATHRFGADRCAILH